MPCTSLTCTQNIWRPSRHGCTEVAQSITRRVVKSSVKLADRNWLHNVTPHPPSRGIRTHSQHAIKRSLTFRPMNVTYYVSSWLCGVDGPDANYSNKLKWHKSRFNLPLRANKPTYIHSFFTLLLRIRREFILNRNTQKNW